MKVAVVLPTYNERDNIRSMIEGLSSATKSIKHHTFTFVVVDDDSPDGTQDEVKKLKKDFPNVVLLTGKKAGLGKALLRGMTYAAETLAVDIIAQMDADLSHDPAVFPKFIQALDRGANFAVGSRYIPGGSIPSNWGIHRKIFSVVGNSIVRLGLGVLHVHDWTGGYRAYTRHFYEKLKGEMKVYQGYVFQIAFLHKSIRLGATVHEVPIKFTDRLYGRSKIAPSEYIRDVLRYVARERYLSIRHGPFGKFLVVGTIGFIINTTVLELLVATGFHPTLGSAVGAELAIVSNFIWNNYWTFNARRIARSNIFKKFIQFNTTSLGAIVIQAGTVWLGTMLTSVDLYRWFYLLGVGIGLVWNYTMYSRVIWKRRS